MKAKRDILTLVAFLAFATSSQAAVVLGGDFTPHKPGSTSVTATYTGFVPWLASFPNPTSPTSLTVNSGTATYSDTTTGPTVDLLGWTKPQGGADLVNNGIGSSSALNLFAAWGGAIRPIVETTGSLHTIGAGDTITISAMVGGPSSGPKSGSFFFSLYAGSTEITPSSVVDQTLPLNEGFQMISRTYDAAALAAFVGQTTKIRLAIPDANTIANRIIFDDVSFAVVPGPSPSPIRLDISPTVGSPGHYDFAWESETGKSYDLVSATELSTDATTWPVWDGRQDLAATPPTNTLTRIFGGDVPYRLFYLIIKDAP